jgi:hypothetical protein
MRAHVGRVAAPRWLFPPDAHARAARSGCASTAAGLLACAADSFLAALLAAHLDDYEHPWIGWLALYVLALGMTVLFAIGAMADAMRQLF